MTFQIRTSERSGSLKRCPQKWKWSIVDGLVPMRAANPLWFGAAVHDGLAMWYQNGIKRGPHPAETFDNSLEGDRSFLVTNEEEEKEYADARTLGIDMLEHYVEFYGKDEGLYFISTEQPFQVWIPHPSGSPKRWLRYVGTFDGVYRDSDTGEIWLIEHKTAASIDPGHLLLDDQAGSYWAVASSKLHRMGLLKSNDAIAGIMYNFLRKSMRDTRPVNEEGLRTNKPVKQHYIDALLNHFGEDSAHAEQWRRDLPKMKLDELDELARAQKIEVLGDVSKSQPPPYFERWPVYRSKAERRTMIRRIQNEAIYAERWRAEDPDFPLYKTPIATGPQACRWSCEFYRMCQLHEQGDEGWKEFRDTMYKTRDPYADHQRKSADI